MPTTQHFHGFRVPAHLCAMCGAAIECGYTAEACRGDNYVCAPCSDALLPTPPLADLVAERRGLG